MGQKERKNEYVTCKEDLNKIYSCHGEVVSDAIIM